MVALQEITLIQAPVERCFDLARSVEVHPLGNLHFGESAIATEGGTAGLIEGEQVTWRARHFWLWHELTSRITRLKRPEYFQDVILFPEQFPVFVKWRFAARLQ